ncbi:MAG: hypothetical protein R3C31_05755 [Hyphomonadaceae bacterium]
MSTNDEGRDDANSGREALGVIAVIAFALAILCLVVFAAFG